MGSAVTQLQASLSLPSSAALCKCSQAFTSVATSSRLLRLSVLRVVLIDCCSCPLSPKQLFCCTISVVSVYSQWCCHSQREGVLLFRSCLVHQSQAPVMSWQCQELTLHVGWAVPSGKDCWRMVSSSGCISDERFSTVLRKYIQRPMTLWVKAQKAA